MVHLSVGVRMGAASFQELGVAEFTESWECYLNLIKTVAMKGNVTLKFYPFFCLLIRLLQ